MSDFDKLTDEELRALFQVDPSAAPINPWHPKFDNTPKGKEIRMRYEAANPTLAAGLKSKAPGFNLSARAEMYNRGLIELDQSIHEELMSVDPAYRKQKEASTADWEAKMLREMDNKVRELQAARGQDPDEVQVINPHLAGRHFKGYAEQVNLEARRERNWQQQGN